ncbi:CBS domain protein [Legionella birminghamensis]|uniref:CBS domain protein n=1 Tax=Legionella birminghamensis TaxID=28083 RepID=A0A378I870_9GAMM|nr:CBS domain-containing protein [Legionella birminghamensis]KTC68048.1 CBS domain protein [Legionella birminghamensis]STX31243.1 CBS domain protein [Legionella birminghamensis]
MAHLIYSALPHPRREIIFIKPDLTVTQCVEMMTKGDIGALVVRDEQSLLGLVSERDIIRECLFKNLRPDETPAIDVAWKNVSILSVNDPIEKAMEIITLTKRRHLLITENGELTAILSIGDLLFHLLEDKARTIEQLENYIHTY